MAYYYAAAIHEEGIVRPEGDIPPSVRALTFDDALDRAEWSEVDEALIEADYPGLLGGA
jgi:hypothetical protein